MKSVTAWLAAVVDTAVLVSIVSTQLVLSDVTSFGLAVSPGDRVAATLHDLVGLGPALLMLVGASFLVAFPVAHVLALRFGGRRVLWFAAAGLCSLPTSIITIKLIMGGTLLASARTPPGMTLVALCGLVGGAFYYWLRTLMDKARPADA